MLKKLVLTLIILFCGIGYVSANPQDVTPQSTDVKIGEQYEAIPQTPPSQEVNIVEESELVRKMEQAKKAENAKKYDSYGGGITIIAMCIVVGALIVLSILFYIFGNISTWFLSHKKRQTAKSLKKDNTGISEDVSPDSGVAIAAIAAALAQHFATDHDMQDTILTIRRMRKAYSPWNSKIYNMRHQPEVVHHPKSNNR